ncbi:MAG: phosphatase PAP2 family protein [Helicobacter sp.]|uniref:phosphatase PAP2 family protein n=1 Tax=Helicobacter sp. TaxID=218 RepID=UPI0025BD9168|nr:phosphatase PAP2 family protein [Helicobacter sp.]MCH5313461.1 phosphatase PAP2 family protein [Helicobacter sp.]
MSGRHICFESLILGIGAVIAVLLWLYNPQVYGNVFRFMLIPLGLFWLIQKQFQPLRYFICVVVVILGIAFGIKMLCAFLASHYEDILWLQDILEIAKRPINGEFKGFPSGHSTAAFSAAALMWYFMGNKWGIFAFILACFVGYSRILSLWHTPTQVFAGAILGFVGSFAVILLLSYIDKTREKKL